MSEQKQAAGALGSTEGLGPVPRCPECNDTGARDSGGTYPWGEAVYLPCDCLANDEPHPDYPCRSDGRCQYAIDSGAEGLGHCPRGKCVMPDGA